MELRGNKKAFKVGLGKQQQDPQQDPQQNQQHL